MTVLLTRVACLALAASAAVLAQPVLNPANGHYYELVENPLSWPDARAAAQAAAPSGFTSHLATVTSPAENDFIAQNVSGYGYAWLGGFQPNPNVAAAAGWEWVTGEVWAYTNWNAGEPNDFYGPGSESYLMFWGGPLWNDQYNTVANWYLVEYEPQSITIDGCDTGVKDVLFWDQAGVFSISDLITQCATGATNHGQFVSCVAELTNRLKAEGVITGKQKGAIQSCAAKAAIP